MHLNAIFHRKEPQFEPEFCTVEKVIELDATDYWSFRCSMMQDHDFITENIPLMGHDKNGNRYGLLVLGESCDDGILVDSQGAEYARYAAFVPGARQLLAMDQLQAEQRFKEQVGQIEGVDMSNAQDWMYHARALAEADAGIPGAAAHHDYLRRLQEFGDAFQRIDQLYEETPAEIFNYKPGYKPDELLPACDYISNGADVEEAYEIAPQGTFDPLRYAVGRIVEDGMQQETAHHDIAAVQKAYGLDAGKLPQLMARLENHEGVDALLIHENRAAFTLCFKPEFQIQGKPAEQMEPLMQEDLIAMHARHILWYMEQPDGVRADFSGRTLSNLDFSGRSFCGANFAGATIHQCRMGQASFENSDFTGATLRGVAGYQAVFIEADFNGTTLEYCDFTEAQFDGTDFSQVEILECDGLDDISQGPTMTMGGM